MIKNILGLIALSILAILFINHVAGLLHWLVHAHHGIDNFLAGFLKGNAVVHVIRATLALIVLPLIGSIVVAAIFSLLKRDATAALIITLWSVWLILLTAVALIK